MTEMDGYELARTIRAREAREGRARTVIIACTANALRGEAANCFAAGMDDYVAKPVDLTQLHAKLERWLHPDAASSQPAPDASPLDRRALDEISRGDSSMQQELMAQFRSAGDQDAERLHAAIGARDLPAVIQLAHRISGASSAIGAGALAAAAARIESAARSGDLHAMVDAEDALRRERARLAAYIALRYPGAISGSSPSRSS